MERDKMVLDVAHAASRLFVKRGYGKTQISDIARAVSVSTGSIYNLFSGKKAIFQFILKDLFLEESSDNTDIPVREEDDRALLEAIRKEMQSRFEQIVRTEIAKPEDLPPLRELLTQIYDFVAKYGTGFLIFERNIADWKEFSDMYYAMRGTFLANFEKYVDLYVQKGEIRPLQHSKYHARLIIETFSMWGMHLAYDYNDIQASAPIAREVALDALIHAYGVHDSRC